MASRPRVGILGPAETLHACAEELGRDHEVVARTDDPGALLSSAADGAIDAAALCNPDAGLAAQLELADRLLRHGLTVVLLRPSVPHGIEGLGLARRRVAGRPLLFLPPRPFRHRPSPAKRLLDVLVSAAVLLLGLPLWCLIAIAVKLQDRGPVFFVQERIGAGGRRFRFIKFRTMWPDADAHREWYEKRHGTDGHVFKLKDDPRRTPVGRLLRRFSIDEAPQLLHVLSGKMSLVGPRPPLPAEVERYNPWQRMRLAGWFGVTGLWQVCGRSEIRNLDDIVLLDALYLHRHSAWLDLRIILRTLRVVVSRHGAY